MEGLIFIVGCVVFCLYITFFMFSSRSVEEEPNIFIMDDAADYDGHGNWGRFPPKKTKIKKVKVKTNKKTTK
tara:strand:- start:124 stop:339 length:216 start_codon:yes stop_codon:yes gene_type:complete